MSRDPRPATDGTPIDDPLWAGWFHDLARMEELDATSELPVASLAVIEPMRRGRAPFADLWCAGDDVQGYGNWFAAEGANVGTKPDRAKMAGQRRRGFLQFALIRSLLAREAAFAATPDRRFSVDSLVETVLSQSFAAGPPVMRPVIASSRAEERDHSAPLQARDRVPEGLMEHLAATVKRIDAAFAIDLRRRIPAACDGTKASIHAWGRVWTACTALTMLDWLRAKAHVRRAAPEAQGLAAALWRGLPVRFQRHKGPLPSRGDRGARLRMLLQHAVAQVFKYVPARRSGRGAVKVRLGRIDDATSGDRHYYRGISVEHLYLAILAEVLSAGETHHSPAVDPRGATQDRAAGAEPHMDAAELDPTQQRIVERLSDPAAARRGRRQPPSRFAPPEVAPDLLENAEAGPAEGAIDFASVGFEPAIQAPAVADQRRRMLGSVELWPSLHRDPLWLDFSCVVRGAGGWVIVPLTLEDDFDEGPGTGQSERTGLILDSASPIGFDELAQAMANPARTKWGYEFAGLGVFVVAVVNIGSASP